MAATFRLLDDQPYPGGDDPLGFEQIARDLAELVLASRASTPLAVGIESGWGMGKSTLMRRLERVLVTDPDVTTVWFNAWTADQGSALEGLVKSVLDRLDRNVLRRAARNERLLSWARALTLVLADWLKLGSLVNTLWTKVSVDPKARNEMRDLVVRSMSEWANVRAELGPERLLVVFVDDLDRCSPVNVLQVFEAIKLYLDAPGMVFIVGYDRDVVSDAILDVKQYSDMVTSHHYLEKIVQLVYRLPSVSDEAAQRILSLYLDSSATDALFDAPARTLTIEQNTRNPRRIKRFINAFILEYGLDAEWERMGAETLVRTLIIDVYFPDFGRLLRARSHRDPVQDFRDYVAVRGILRRGEPPDSDALRVKELFESFGIAVPAGNPSEVLEALEQEVPPSFPKLAQNPDFLTLLDGLGDVQALREKLRRYTPTAVRRTELAGQIMIAYRRGRSSGYAGRIHDALTAHFGSERLFMDTASIELGADFQQMIEGAIGSASVILAIIDPDFVGPQLANPHDPLRTELAFALARPNTRVIPILVAGALMPTAEQLPENLAPLARRNALELSDARFAHDLSRLTDAIEYLGTAARA